MVLQYYFAASGILGRKVLDKTTKLESGKTAEGLYVLQGTGKIRVTSLHNDVSKSSSIISVIRQNQTIGP